MDKTYEKRGYLLEDFRLFHLQEPQKAHIDFHYHEFCKLMLLHSGSGGYCVEGRHYQLQAGDLVLVGCRCIHRPEFEPGSPYERTIIYISPEFLRKNSTPDCDLESCFTQAPSHVLRPGRQQQKLFSLADRLEQELSADGYGRVILSSSLLLGLLVEIARAIRQEGTMPTPSQPGSARVQEILRYLDAHLTEDITIEQLAQEFFLSKYHMMRLFRRETGESIHGYLSERRLLHAKDLMQQGKSATQACFLSGWGSYSSFTRAYSKRFGTTPTGRRDPAARAEATYE